MEFIRSLIAWVGVHPGWAVVVIGLVALGESLAFVGLLVPGALLMFAAGALIAGGTLPFWPIVIAAIAGAILGDGASYVLGRRYRDRVRTLWPFSKHPELLDRGERFFHRHGGKSVVLGRFVGPIRPIIPVVAGMLGMPPGRFYVTNILSALAWAPGYLLPGIALGASLALAGEVAGRLAALLGIVVVGIWLIVWLVRWLFTLIQPHAAEWGQQCLDWARAHRGTNWLIGDLLDPAGPAARALFLWTVLLIGGSWLLVRVTQQVVTGDPLGAANEALYQMLQALRTPVGDRVMIVFSQIGDWPVTTATTIAALVWLLWRRARRDAVYWLTAIAFASLTVLSLKLLLKLPRPIDAYSGADAYSFPSGHATMSVVIYGYLAVLGAHDLAVRWRWLPYAGATLLVGAISFSRLYLGAHWLTDVAAGLGLGLAGVSVIAIARERHIRSPHGIGVLWVAMTALAVSLVWHASLATTRDLERYAVRKPIKTLAAAGWWAKDWQTVPAQRIDLGGDREQPLNVQWSGSIEALRDDLLTEGWQSPTPLTASSALRWLAPDLPLTEMPLIPRLHDGRPEAIALTFAPPAFGPERRLLLRLWPTSFRLEPGDEPLWVGTVTSLKVRRLPLLAFPTTTGAYDEAASSLADGLRHLQRSLRIRSSTQPGSRNRFTLLLRPAPIADAAPR
jgi:membrane protein DedA with SNARE-associated domain